MANPDAAIPVGRGFFFLTLLTPCYDIPFSNKCLMLDVFVVLRIPGVHRLLPTTSTVQGVNSSFIPTENGDERLDCACADVTITG